MPRVDCVREADPKCNPPPPPPTCLLKGTCVLINDSECPIASACASNTQCCSANEQCINNKCAQDACPQSLTCGNNCCWNEGSTCINEVCVDPCLPGEIHLPKNSSTCCLPQMACGDICCGNDPAEVAYTYCSVPSAGVCCPTGTVGLNAYWGDNGPWYCCQEGETVNEYGCQPNPGIIARAVGGFASGVLRSIYS
jgi:hypothetical protein